MSKHHSKPDFAVGERPTVRKTAIPAAIAPDCVSEPARTISADATRLSAYRKWERAGKPAGDGMQFWLEAERELISAS